MTACASRLKRTVDGVFFFGAWRIVSEGAVWRSIDALWDEGSMWLLMGILDAFIINSEMYSATRLFDYRS